MKVIIQYKSEQIEKAKLQPDIAQVWFGEWKNRDWYKETMITLMILNRFSTNSRKCIEKRYAVESDSVIVYTIGMDWNDSLALDAKEGKLKAFQFVGSEGSFLGKTLTFELLVP